MTKPLAIPQRETTRRDQQAGYSLPETLKLTCPSSASGFHLASIHFCTKIGLWLAGLLLGGIFVYICLHYWAVAIATSAIGIGMLLLIWFLDDGAPQEAQPDLK